MKIISKRFCDWDVHVRSRLKKLTLPGGYLQYYIQAAPQSETFVAFSDDGLILGWLFVLHINGRSEANIYVSPDFRKMGLGTRLVRVASRKHRPLYLCTWDSGTLRLFTKLRRELPGRVALFNWLKHEREHIDWLVGLGISVG